MIEMKNLAYGKLQAELENAQQALTLKDEEMEKLKEVHGRLDREIQDLTASLFEEANRMVQEANIKRMAVEKHLAEYQSKLEGLEAENCALKALVLTSTPAAPNKHLHPQLSPSARRHSTSKDTAHQQASSHSKKKARGHQRSSSHHVVTTAELQLIDIDASPPEAEQKDTASVGSTHTPADRLSLAQLSSWRAAGAPTQDPGSPFLGACLAEDVTPCLRFTSPQLTEELLAAIRQNSLAIDPASPSSAAAPGPDEAQCALCGDGQAVRAFTVRLSDTGPKLEACSVCRERVAAACDFFTYLRYLNLGLVKQSDEDVWWRVQEHRRNMTLARLALPLQPPQPPAL